MVVAGAEAAQRLGTEARGTKGGSVITGAQGPGCPETCTRPGKVSLGWRELREQPHRMPCKAGEPPGFSHLLLLPLPPVSLSACGWDPAGACRASFDVVQSRTGRRRTGPESPLAWDPHHSLLDHCPPSLDTASRSAFFLVLYMPKPISCLPGSFSSSPPRC